MCFLFSCTKTGFIYCRRWDGWRKWVLDSGNIFYSTCQMINYAKNVCVFVVSPTCVSLSVATEGPLRCPMAPVFSPVSVSGTSSLFWDCMLHVVVVCPSFVSVTTPRPAVAQGGGGAFHWTAVIDGLREEEKETTKGWREREKCKERCFLWMSGWCFIYTMG